MSCFFHPVSCRPIDILFSTENFWASEYHLFTVCNPLTVRAPRPLHSAFRSATGGFRLRNASNQTLSGLTKGLTRSSLFILCTGHCPASLPLKQGSPFCSSEQAMLLTNFLHFLVNIVLGPHGRHSPVATSPSFHEMLQERAQ